MKGAERAECLDCTKGVCDEYMATSQGPCGYCGCAPLKHVLVIKQTHDKNEKAVASLAENEEKPVLNTIKQTQDTNEKEMTATQAGNEESSPNSDSERQKQKAAGKRKSLLGDGILHSEEARKRILLEKKIRLHDSESIAASSGEKKKKKIFENAKYLDLMRQRNMREKNKTALKGVVSEAYTEYSSQQELLAADELCSDVKKLKNSFNKEELGKISIKTVNANLEKVRLYQKLKQQVHQKLKSNFVELSNNKTTLQEREQLRRQKNILESEMADYASKLRKAKDALRKSTGKTNKDISDFLSSKRNEQDDDGDADLLKPEEINAAAAEIKAESDLAYQED